MTDPEWEAKTLAFIDRLRFENAFRDRHEAARSAMETDEGREHVAVAFAELLTEADFEAL